MLALPSQAAAVQADYTKIVGNQSSRGGAAPSLIVVHTTTDPDGGRPVFRDRPGLKDLKRLGRWFDNPRSAVSSHVANDAQGHDARYVRDRRMAWTEVAFNSVGLSIEQVGTDEYSRRTWLRQRAPQLENTAYWIAHWHRKWGIPMRRAQVDGPKGRSRRCRDSLAAWKGRRRPQRSGTGLSARARPEARPVVRVALAGMTDAPPDRESPTGEETFA